MTYYQRENNWFYQLNELLRKRNVYDLNLIGGYLHYLFSGLNKLPNISKEIYRGIPNSMLSKVEKDYVLHRPIHWSGFSSGTDDIETAKSFAKSKGIIFKIRVFTGKSIENYSFIPKENEILLSPNLKLKVIESIK